MITGKAKLAGVLGWPVSHSRSPLLHGHWIATHGLDAAYLPLPVRPERFADAVRSLADLGFRGANVTIPHKEAAYALCDARTGRAERAGAVNTLVFAEGRITGDCTDGWGFLASLGDFDPRSGPAVLLGAGGAARAIAAALLDAGCPRVTLVNRTPARAEALARALGGPVAVAAEPPLADAALLVNTTSLGMQGQPPLALDLGPLPARAMVADIVYVPLETPLLAAARARGLRAVGGLGMLLHQARPGFQAWFGVLPEVDDALHDVIARDIPPR
ncbi:MAG: shikimate dehydrogenase [Acetobacteraceae bacterium]|nr:shikimate dehydrogenase [Acetobacteraceae bacterium]